MTDLRPNKPRRRWAWCCCSAVLVLALVPLIVYLVTLKTSGARLAAEIARLRQAGEPVTLEECAPKIGEGEENAADLYQAAFNVTPASLSASASQAPPNESEATRAAREQDLVANNQEYLSILQEASRIPKCAFPHDWSQGPGFEYPEWGPLGEARRALIAQAEVARRAGRTDAAVAACNTLLRVADQLQQSPAYMSYAIASGMRSRAVRELASIYSSGDPSPAAAQSIYRQLTISASLNNLATGLKHERAYGLSVFIAMVDPNAKVSFGDDTLDEYHKATHALRPFTMNDELAYLTAMRKYLEALPKPYPEAVREMDAAESESEQLNRLALRMPLISACILPVGSYLLWQGYQARALAGAAQVATAAKAYKVAHGQYPASLQELARDGWRLPSDPFTSTPYRYAREKQGIAVWSVGPDLTDNGGVNYDPQVHKDRDQPGYDYVFRCSR